MRFPGPNEQIFPYYDKERCLLGRDTIPHIREMGRYVLVAEGAIISRFGMFLQVRPKDDPLYPLALDLTARTKVRYSKKLHRDEESQEALTRGAKPSMGVAVDGTLLIGMQTRTYERGGGAHIDQYLGWTRTHLSRVGDHLRELHATSDYVRYPETIPQLEALMERQPMAPGFADFMRSAIESLVLDAPEKYENGTRVDPIAWFGRRANAGQ